MGGPRYAVDNTTRMDCYVNTISMGFQRVAAILYNGYASLVVVARYQDMHCLLELTCTGLKRAALLSIGYAPLVVVAQCQEMHHLQSLHRTWRELHKDNSCCLQHEVLRPDAFARVVLLTFM